jgi:membrane protein
VQRVAALGKILILTYRSLVRHDILTLAAAIAYSALLSLFPLLIGIIALFSRFVDQATAQHAIMRALDPYLPPGVRGIVQEALEGAISKRGTAGAVTTLVLFWTAMAVASTLLQSLNRVLDAPTTLPFWRRKVVELAMVSMGGALIMLSVFASAALAFLGAVPALEGIINTFGGSRIWGLVLSAGPWIFSGTAFIVVYRFVPNVRVRRRSLLIGSLVAMTLFELTKRAFFWYLLRLAQYPLAYGPLAGVVVFLVWVYLASLVALIGAALIRQVEDYLSHSHRSEAELRVTGEER